MSRKEDKIAKGPLNREAMAIAAARFRALPTEQAKYDALTQNKLGVMGRENAHLISDNLADYWPWRGPLKGRPEVIVTLNYAEWLQAALYGSI